MANGPSNPTLPRIWACPTCSSIIYRLMGDGSIKCGSCKETLPGARWGIDVALHHTYQPPKEKAPGG